MAEEVLYRVAKLQDYQEVINIDTSFLDDFDYVPNLYRYWCHAPEYFISVAEVNGKVVIFEHM